MNEAISITTFDGINRNKHPQTRQRQTRMNKSILLRALVITMALMSANATVETAANATTNVPKAHHAYPNQPIQSVERIQHGSSSSRNLLVFSIWGMIQGWINGVGDDDPVEQPEPIAPNPSLPSTSSFSPIRINCGGNAYTDTSGVDWIKDMYFNTGISRRHIVNTLFPTQDNLLYQTYRFDFRISGEPLTYKIPVPNGEYSVVLYFSDFGTLIGGDLRRFNVLIENSIAFDSTAITEATVPEATKTVTMKSTAVVRDEELSIEFEALSRNPFVSAIEVLGVGTPMPAVSSEAPTRSPSSAITTVAPQPLPTYNLPPIFNFNPTTDAPVSETSTSSAPTVAPATKSPTSATPTRSPVIKPIASLSPTKNPSRAPTTAPVAAITGAPTTKPVAPLTASPTTTPTEAATVTPTTLAPATAPAQPSTSFETMRINSGGPLFTDFLGNVWQEDDYFIGGGTYADGRYDVNGTQADAVYQTERNTDFTYEIPVPIGNYEIILHFAELYHPDVGQRLFDVTVEGEEVFKEVDIVKIAEGYWNAVTLETVQIVSDGAVSISFSSLVDHAKVSAVEIKIVGDHLAHAVAGGSYSGVDTDGDGVTKIAVDGSTSHTHGQGLTLVDYIWREGATVVGNGESVDLELGVGEHTITLTVVDSGGNDSSEATTVTVADSSFPAVASLSPDSASTAGNVQVTILGSGFKHAAADTTVHFGAIDFSGHLIQIVKETEIRVTAPSSVLGVPVQVSVETPAGNSNSIPFTYISGGAIEFASGEIINYLNPTVVRFGPDRKLYIGTVHGKLLKLGFQDGNLKVTQYVENTKAAQYRAIMGIAFDPMDTSENPLVYFSHGFFFHNVEENSSGNAVNGKVSTASGADLSVITDIITGLPVSDHDHSVNGIEFGDSGELYIQIGGNTNAGVAGQLSGSGKHTENVLSAATLVAHLSRPNFDGFITYSADNDGDQTGGFDVEVFAPGQRNPFGIVLHSNGNIYGTDNGPNLGYGDIALGCPNGDSTVPSLPDKEEEDKLNLIRKGKYYGHANHKRGESDPRQCVWRSSYEESGGGYTAPLMELQASSDGIIEWTTNHFGGQLRGNLIVAKYNADIYRVILSPDGESVIPESKPAIPLVEAEGLSISLSPMGEIIEGRFEENDIFYHRPIEDATTKLRVLNVWPSRGGLAGGSTLHVYGKNLNKNGKTPTITVGGSPCPVTQVKSFRVACTLPGGTGMKDVVVKVDGETETFSKAYRYIQGAE